MDIHKTTVENTVQDFHNKQKYFVVLIGRVGNWR